MSRNKLLHIPSYFAQFHHLDILKIDHNPLEWPDKSILQPTGNIEDPDVMKAWIRDLQKYLDDETRKVEHRKVAEDSFSSELDEFEQSLCVTTFTMLIGLLKRVLL